MKDKNGIKVKFRGWVQHGSSCDTEIAVLEIYHGSSTTRIYVDMSCDEMVEWCKSHNFDFTDMRKSGDA